MAKSVRYGRVGRCLVAIATVGALAVAMTPTAASAHPVGLQAVPASGSGSVTEVVSTGSTVDAAAAVPFGRPYTGSGIVADEQGVSFAAVTGLGLASVGAVAIPDAIIGGTDNRTRVTATSSFPYSAVVHIVGTNPAGGSVGCSGFLYGANAVATAGHCVYDRAHHGWNTNLQIIPGQNGSTQPFGHCGSIASLTTTTAYVNNGTTTEDYAAIKMNCSMGNATRWFGFIYPANKSQTWRVTGYPGDKPAGTMWTATGQITVQNSGETDYNIDMMGGESGGPVYNSGAYVTAINAYGVGTSYNAGPSLTPTRMDNLHAWA
jgi:glutamyl endopeptidase